MPYLVSDWHAQVYMGRRARLLQAPGRTYCREEGLGKESLSFLGLHAHYVQQIMTNKVRSMLITDSKSTVTFTRYSRVRAVRSKGPLSNVEQCGAWPH